VVRDALASRLWRLAWVPLYSGMTLVGMHAVRTMRYAIVIEKADSNYSAYVPDLPGCVATGATPQETEELLREAIAFHLAGLREDRQPIPEPSSRVDYMDIQLPGE
jgi:predicted RNase H-like HicB family nuclease